MRRILVPVFLALFARMAAAGSLAGVTLPDGITVEGKPLVLNGMGIRKVTIFRVKVYVAGLYLQARSRSADEIIRSEQVKQLDIVLVRDVDRDEIVDVFRKGLKNNGADMVRIKGRFDRFVAWMSDFHKRDTISFRYVPGTGVTVTINGKIKGTLGGSDFGSSLFAIWLGPSPADGDLKNALLGK